MLPLSGSREVLCLLSFIICAIACDVAGGVRACSAILCRCREREELRRHCDERVAAANAALTDMHGR
jgi:hypothetical protein